MRITVVGVVVVIVGILMLALFVEHVHRRMNEQPKSNQPKGEDDEQPNLS